MSDLVDRDCKLPVNLVILAKVKQHMDIERNKYGKVAPKLNRLPGKRPFHGKTPLGPCRVGSYCNFFDHD